MKKIKLFLGALLLFSAFGLQAQVTNVGAGAAFMGSIRFKMEGANDHGTLYVNNYRPLLGATAFYEKSGSGASHMFELSYSTGALQNVQQGEYYIEGWDPATFESAKVISGFYYLGFNNRSAQRFQLPFYAGIGISYTEANPITYLGWNFGAKLRAKYYITNNIGIWAGASATLGFGNAYVTTDETRSVTQRLLALEAGITFSL